MRAPGALRALAPLGLALLLAPAPLRAQATAPDAPAELFVLDYDVPESPGLVALGASSAKILRAGAAKPAVASLVNSFLTGGEVQSGIALDAAPYFLLGGRLESIRAYREQPLKRILANTLLSVATVQGASDTSSLSYGIGVRITLWDDQDLLFDPDLGGEIDSVLLAALPAAPVFDPTTGELVRKPASIRVDLTEVHRRAEQRALATRGHALSVGWALSGGVRGGIASFDSLGASRHRAWLAYRYRARPGLDLLSTAQWQEGDSVTAALLLGVAFRATSPGYAFGTELYYESGPEGADGGLAAGGSAEIRVTQGLRFVAGLLRERDEAGVPRVRLRTTVRWAMAGAP